MLVIPADACHWSTFTGLGIGRNLSDHASYFLYEVNFMFVIVCQITHFPLIS